MCLSRAGRRCVGRAHPICAHEHRARARLPPRGPLEGQAQIFLAQRRLARRGAHGSRRSRGSNKVFGVGVWCRCGRHTARVWGISLEFGGDARGGCSTSDLSGSRSGVRTRTRKRGRGMGEYLVCILYNLFVVNTDSKCIQLVWNFRSQYDNPTLSMRKLHVHNFCMDMRTSDPLNDKIGVCYLEGLEVLFEAL